MRLAGGARNQQLLRSAYYRLGTLRDRLSLCGSVPQAVGIATHGRYLVTLESCLRGTPLTVLLARRERSQSNIEEDLFHMQVWLHDFQTAHAGGHAPLGSWLSALERDAGAHPAIGAAGRRLMAEAGTFREVVLPLVAQHGALVPRHILRTDAGIGVIDWKHYRIAGLPTDDAFTAAVEYAMALDAHSRAPFQRFASAFVNRHAISERIAEFLSRYFKAIHLPAEAAHALFGLYLVRRALQSTDGGWIELLTYYAQSAHQAPLRSMAQ
jgi:hypothetical protein